MLQHPGQPIDMIGRLIPHFNGEQWDVSEEVFERAETRSWMMNTIRINMWNSLTKLLFLLCTKENA